LRQRFRLVRRQRHRRRRPSPWTYTIGFYDSWSYPEIILIGRRRATAHHILDTIADALDANQPPDLSLATAAAPSLSASSSGAATWASTPGKKRRRRLSRRGSPSVENRYKISGIQDFDMTALPR